jgi:Protein of unknown function (DUF2934)
MESKEKKNEALKARTGPIQPGAENISVSHAPGLGEIRLRAYEIYLERGGLPGNELEDWLQAERELKHAVPPKAQQFLVAGESE